MKYFGNWSSLSDMVSDFEGTRWGSLNQPGDGGNNANPDFPTDDQIIFAAYGNKDYSGQCFVLYEKDGKLFEVNSGHCSCYGLEGSWSPEETSWEAIKMRPDVLKDYTDWTQEAHDELKRILEAH